jgi:uncharacterized protein DUF4304
VSEIAKRIKLIVDRGLAPSLKQAGFRRTGMNFFRQHGEAVQTVNVQSSRWNSDASGSFTINVGVDFAEVAQLMPGFMPMPSFPKEYCCILRIRVGEIMPARKDCWWEVAENTNAEALAAELVTVWTSYIVPWLDAYSTVSALASKPNAGEWRNPYMRAAAHIVAGDRTRAAQYVEAEINRINEDPDANHQANAKLQAERLAQLPEWATKQGLTVRT